MLKVLLEAQLPQGIEVAFHYLKGALPPRTPSKKKLKQPLPETQFLTVYEADLLILALEVLVYKAENLTTVYISKADSTGCHSKGVSLSTLALCFLKQLLAQQIGKVRLVLFARSQPQYLFPGSSENEGKHLLGDRELVHWWVGILERLRGISKDATACIIVPGSDDQEVERTYLAGYKAGWRVGFTDSPQALAKDVLLRFPDDPKARFLDQLSLDKAIDTTSLAQFWELMAYRQEMSSGRSVAFLQLDTVSEYPADTNVPSWDFLDLSDKKLAMLRDELGAQTFTSREETLLASERWLRLVPASTDGDAKPVCVFGRATLKTVAKADGKTINASKTSEMHKRPASDTQPNILVPRKRQRPKP
ncbi:histone acetylation protein-domain-containing protein [Protomyces lactucae-debilis]|uniref:histone acetyltransferase n=1 Tax=Protomyces lactucae-debilis TaxID=2754530 RepID=A0A1Y2F556_PROLT|nr:histone acetylation protein-domain-containing protein [Protomyces lactucae-debilis]ORY78991.1 histone acetylation protein-domain-containing protein [Protomyces lactucae-debilis]